ncbi:MAG: ribosome biogenesis GTP-binding protein YihA/YsxC [Bacillales bacterium]|nr:ribosome biogenesis GTP-binding protein YihA/YsxC [Bacillales bacterium]
MINFRKANFIKSATSDKDSLFDLNHVIFIGRSNVGKSSLINALVDNKNLAFVSKKPGQTKLLNYFNIDNKFYLVDAPGYGYRRTGKKDGFDKMMESYFSSNSRLKLVLWLLDSRRELSQEDLEFKDFLENLQTQVLICFTKCDKLNQSEKAKIVKIANNQLSQFDYVLCSSFDKKSIEQVRQKISQIV